MFVQSGRSVASAALPFVFFPFVFFTVMTRVVAVIFMNRVPVMIGKYESDRCWNAYDGTGLNDNADIDKIQHYVAVHVDQKYLAVIKNVLRIVRRVGQLPCQSRGKHLHMNSRGKNIMFMQSRRPMAMLITVMGRVVAVIIMNRVPVMIGKYESDRRRNADSNVYQGLDDHATPVSAAMAVDDTTGNKHRSYEQRRPIGSVRNQRVIGFCRE
ncbi:MAG: hypothetical protein O6704_08060 [Nitrospinae bacterium]|nr:hypothetical protein [Nitrospinota bacterium]